MSTAASTAKGTHSTVRSVVWRETAIRTESRRRATVVMDDSPGIRRTPATGSDIAVLVAVSTRGAMTLLDENGLRQSPRPPVRRSAADYQAVVTAPAQAEGFLRHSQWTKPDKKRCRPSTGTAPGHSFATSGLIAV
ncbi:hypothetical protein GCM10009838_45370 [Catenulispora subtropica]|uniref:Transposase n=1 Tax=Catenulispora subtropica TaxID=450798 RepID=A0ABP5DFP0_9ACTN